MKSLIKKLSFLVFCCAINRSIAQTFSLNISGVETYAADFKPAANADHFLSAILFIKPSFNVYCARIDHTGNPVWQKVFKTQGYFPQSVVLGTSDNGALLFIKDRINGKLLNYAIVIKCDSSGNIEWSKRFQLTQNQIIYPSDIAENSHGQYVLLYDVVDNDISYSARPQIAVFNTTGELVSQTGVEVLYTYPTESYYSTSLFVNNKDEYFIGGVHRYDSYGSAETQNIIDLKLNKVPQLAEIQINKSNELQWLTQLIQKNGKLNIVGGYGVKSGLDYKYSYSYASIDDSSITTNTSLINFNLLVMQKLVNNGTINFPIHGFFDIRRNKSFTNVVFTDTGYNINRYDSAGRICPLNNLPQLDTGIKIKTFGIVKRNLNKMVDSIAFVNDFNIAVTDTSLVTINCNSNITETKSLLSQKLATNTNEIKIYPNPAGSNATVKFNLTNTANVSIDLLSTQGALLESYKEKITAGNYTRNINIASLNAGLYFLRININGKQTVLKLIRE